MKKIIFFFAFISSLALTSCSFDVNPCGNDKVQFLENYNEFMTEVDNKDYGFSDEEWVEYDEKFKKMVEECYEVHEGEMTFKEEKKFWAKTVTYYIQRYGIGFVAELENDDSKLNQAIKAHFSDVKKEVNFALGDLDLNLNLDAEEIESLVEELGTDLEKLGSKWGKKLEKIIKKNK